MYANVEISYQISYMITLFVVVSLPLLIVLWLPMLNAQCSCITIVHCCHIVLKYWEPRKGVCFARLPYYIASSVVSKKYECCYVFCFCFFLFFRFKRKLKWMPFWVDCIIICHEIVENVNKQCSMENKQNQMNNKTSKKNTTTNSYRYFQFHIMYKVKGLNLFLTFFRFSLSRNLKRWGISDSMPLLRNKFRRRALLLVCRL